MAQTTQTKPSIDCSSWPMVTFLALGTFTFAKGLPFFFESVQLPLSILLALECGMGLQLILAWRRASAPNSAAVVYTIAALFFFRIAFHLISPGSVMWAFQVNSIPSFVCPLVWYGVGVSCLHPKAFAVFQRLCQMQWSVSTNLRLLLSVGLLLLSGFLFWLFRSAYITNDGQDWILRMQEPVWHLYMREPLIIGLHRLAYLAAGWFIQPASERVLATSVLAGLSVLAGMWSLCWLHALCARWWQQSASRVLALLLLLSSGGFTILLFGHIEVYPIFIAGLLPTLYYAQRYLDHQSSIGTVALWLSLLFGMHLSAGWLLPAFALLPWIRGKSPWLDSIILGSVFFTTQTLLWGSLFLFYYQSDPVRFFTRLHETFHVGPDRAMFLPSYAIGSIQHLVLLFNNYLYLSLPGVILLPLSAWAARQKLRPILFWLALAGGYFLYTFFWNPDRGYPEDWDLFSPFALLLCLTHLKILIKSEEAFPAALYVGAMGALPYVLYQITFHHITQFMRVPILF
ncbi:MAG: hypothetical protein RBU29_04935 [bacterium]|nr:hypothetical protein [bacterium]